MYTSKAKYQKLVAVIFAKTTEFEGLCGNLEYLFFFKFFMQILIILFCIFTIRLMLIANFIFSLYPILQLFGWKERFQCVDQRFKQIIDL